MSRMYHVGLVRRESKRFKSSQKSSISLLHWTTNADSRNNITNKNFGEIMRLPTTDMPDGQHYTKLKQLLDRIEEGLFDQWIAEISFAVGSEESSEFVEQHLEGLRIDVWVGGKMEKLFATPDKLLMSGFSFRKAQLGADYWVDVLSRLMLEMELDRRLN